MTRPTLMLAVWWVLILPTGGFPTMLGPFPTEGVCQLAGHAVTPHDYRFWSRAILRDALLEIRASRPTPDQWARAKAGREGFLLSESRFAGLTRRGTIGWIIDLAETPKARALTGCLFIP